MVSTACLSGTSHLTFVASFPLKHFSVALSLPGQYYIKPFVQRKQRYNRWVRRRSMEKINRILERVRYEKAK
jgi:hypothetical protein